MNKPTLNELESYEKYLLNVSLLENLTIGIKKLQDQLRDDSYEQDEDLFYDDDKDEKIAKLLSLDPNSYLSFEVDYEYESNDEGGSYVHVSHLTVNFPEFSLGLNWSNAEFIMDFMGNYSELYEYQYVFKNVVPTEPLLLRVVEND